MRRTQTIGEQMTIINKLMFLILTISVSLSFAKPDHKIEKLTWKKVISSSKIDIHNPLGDIRVRFGGYKNEIEVIAMVQHNETKGVVEVVEKNTGDTYLLTVQRVNKRSGEIIKLNQNDKTRIDFTVYIPSGRFITATTDHGLIEARKMKDPVKLISNSGDIKLRDNKNTITAFTKRGNITANLITIESQEKQSFSSISGKIIISIAENSPQTVTLESSGDIISDFSSEVKLNFSNEPNKVAKIIANGGGAVIHAKNKIGSIAFKAIPVEHSINQLSLNLNKRK